MCQDRDGGLLATVGISSFAWLDAILILSSQNPFLLDKETEGWEVKTCALGTWLPNFFDHVPR